MNIKGETYWNEKNVNCGWFDTSQKCGIENANEIRLKVYCRLAKN